MVSRKARRNVVTCEHMPQLHLAHDMCLICETCNEQVKLDTLLQIYTYSRWDTT
jgi:hypothetical protein